MWWAVAATEHGAAVTVTPDTPAAGRTLGQLGQVWQVITDERGVWSALVTVAGVPTVHTAAGVVGLLQSRAGLVWATAAGETAE